MNRASNRWMLLATAVILITTLVVAIPLVLTTEDREPTEKLTPIPRVAPVSVMTWNVWAEIGIRDGYPLEDRVPYVVERIQSVRPDLLMLQEAGASRSGPWLRSHIQSATGLTAVGPTELGKKARKIWYNPARLEQMAAGSWTIPIGPGRPKQVTWARLRLKDSGVEFYALSIHLYHLFSADRVRSRQMTWILDRLDETNTSGLPVVIGADLNSNQYRAVNAPVSVLEKRGYVDALDATESTPVNADMVSAFGRVVRTTLKVRRKDRPQVDYIFTSQDTRVHSWALVPQAPIRAGRYTRLISDHNAITATITLDQAGPPEGENP